MSNKRTLKQLAKDGFPPDVPAITTIQVFKDRELDLAIWLKEQATKDERSVNAFAIRLLKKAMADALAE